MAPGAPYVASASHIVTYSGFFGLCISAFNMNGEHAGRALAAWSRRPSAARIVSKKAVARFFAAAATVPPRLGPHILERVRRLGLEHRGHAHLLHALSFPQACPQQRAQHGAGVGCRVHPQPLRVDEAQECVELYNSLNALGTPEGAILFQQ